MAQPNKDELLAEARERGLDESAVPDDATKAQIQEALDKLGPTPDEAAQQAAQDAIDAQANAPEPEEEFEVSRLTAESLQFFGQPVHVAAGALAGFDRITLPQAKAAIDSWLGATVQEVQI